VREALAGGKGVRVSGTMNAKLTAEKCPKRDRSDARYSAQQPDVDDDVRPQYEAFLAGGPLPSRENG